MLLVLPSIMQLLMVMPFVSPYYSKQTLMRLLLKRNTKRIPLHSAAYNGHWKTCAALLAANAATVKVKDGEGRTALHRAACRGFGECAEGLLANGADLEVTDNHGKTALMLAQDFKREDVVQRLLKLSGIIQKPLVQDKLTPQTVTLTEQTPSDTTPPEAPQQPLGEKVHQNQDGTPHFDDQATETENVTHRETLSNDVTVLSSGSSDPTPPVNPKDPFIQQNTNLKRDLPTLDSNTLLQQSLPQQEQGPLPLPLVASVAVVGLSIAFYVFVL